MLLVRQARVSLLQVTLDKQVNEPGHWDFAKVGGWRRCPSCNGLLWKWVMRSTAGDVVGSTVSFLEEDNSCGGGGVGQDYYGMSWLV
jgi:hypothetical protein